MKGRYLIIFAVLMVLITGCGKNHINEIKDTSKGEPSRLFNQAELQKANEALAKGFKIEDSRGDFYKFPEGSVEGDGRPDNSNPYPLGYTDLKSFTIGADEKYVYMKYEYWDKFPGTLPSYEGDLIWSIGAKIDEMLYYRAGKADLAELGIGVSYSYDRPEAGKEINMRALDKPALGQLTMFSPTGIDPTMETIHQNITGAGLVYGGSGTDYLISAVPLEVFGIHLGDEIIFSVATETGSLKYHHEAVDLLLQEGNNKSGDKIRYKLGSNTYQRMSVSDYENLPDKSEIDTRVRENIT